MVKNMWMVRAGEGAYLIDDFKKKNIIAIGWNKIGDISKIKTKEKIKELVEQKDNYTKKSQISTAAGQISRFLFNFKKGDYVISYNPDDRVYLIGEIKSDYQYNTKLIKYHHTRKVKWLGKVNRDNLLTSTRNTLGAISAIFWINDNAKKEIIGVLEGKEQIKDKIVEESNEENIKKDMESSAHELIKDKILKLDWEDVEELVAGILRAMGYQTYITERGADRGRDIEASKDGLMLEEPRILVEVKHKKERMGRKEIGSFQNLLKGRKGIYVSIGGFSKEAKYEAERNTEQLTLINADRLIKLIIQNYDNFDADTKLLIPLSKIYWPSN